MAAYKFPSSGFDNVRAAIGLDVDEVLLPDNLLTSPVHKGEAERWIMRKMTEAQYTNEGQKDEIEYAATLYLAALVVPKLRIVSSERITGGNITYEKVDLGLIASRLEQQAETRINDILVILNAPTTSTDLNPNFFGVAKRILSR